MRVRGRCDTVQTFVSVLAERQALWPTTLQNLTGRSGSYHTVSENTLVTGGRLLAAELVSVRSGHRNCCIAIHPVVASDPPT